MPSASSTLRGSSISESIERSHSHVRDSTKSTDGWQMRGDGKWYKCDYYKLQDGKAETPREIFIPNSILPPPTMSVTPTPSPKKDQSPTKATGIHILNNFFVGSYEVVKNSQWLRMKQISRVLVLGAHSGVEVRAPMMLRVVEIDECNPNEKLDAIMSLLNEAVQEKASVLMVDRDNRTHNPLVLVAYLISVANWGLQAALDRIKGIYNVDFTDFQLSCLRKWNETIQQRRNASKSEASSRSSTPQPTLTLPQWRSTDIATTASATSLINPLATSVINPIATSIINPFATSIINPLAAELSVMNPLYTTPAISATSLINPLYYDTTLSSVSPILCDTTSVVSVTNPLFVAPAITIESAGPAISATSLINPLAIAPPLYESAPLVVSEPTPLYYEPTCTAMSYYTPTIPTVNSYYTATQHLSAPSVNLVRRRLSAPAVSSTTLFGGRQRVSSLYQSYNTPGHKEFNYRATTTSFG